MRVFRISKFTVRKVNRKSLVLVNGTKIFCTRIIDDFDCWIVVK